MVSPNAYSAFGLDMDGTHFWGVGNNFISYDTKLRRNDTTSLLLTGAGSGAATFNAAELVSTVTTGEAIKVGVVASNTNGSLTPLRGGAHFSTTKKNYKKMFYQLKARSILFLF